MRRRGTGPGVRAELAAEHRRFEVLYGYADERIGLFADRIEAGEEVEVPGYEVGLPGVHRVRVEPDGSVTPAGGDR